MCFGDSRTSRDSRSSRGSIASWPSFGPGVGTEPLSRRRRSSRLHHLITGRKGVHQPANGKLHLNIPLVSVPERAGGRYKAALVFGSNIWGYNYFQNVRTAQNKYLSVSGWRLITSSDSGYIPIITVVDGGWCGPDKSIEWDWYEGWAWYTDNSSNELTSTSNASFTYDNDGNMMSKTLAGGTTNYSWDFENQMAGVTLPGSGGTVSFKYDPLGRRICKSSSSATSIFVYDLMARKANCCARSSPLQAQKGPKIKNGRGERISSSDAFGPEPDFNACWKV